MSQSNINERGFSSTAVHAGHKTAENYSHITPIYATSTFVYDSAEQGMNRFNGTEDGYIYTRWGNPLFDEAEEKISALEGFGIQINGAPIKLKARLHASGMAAISTLMIGNLKPGDKILTHYSLYGGTEQLLKGILAPLHIEPIIVDLTDLNIAKETLDKNPEIKLVYIETPANPTIQCVDIEEVTKLAKEKNLIVAVDNTFSTPYIQQPFKYGVDFVVHSTTKFLNGHGSAVGGVLVGKDIEFMNTKIDKTRRFLGSNSNPFDAYLLIQGIKTLEVRMERHCANAATIANFLNNHEQVAKVNYPGLETHPNHQTSLKQMNHPGPMMSFELKGGLEAGKKFINKLQMCTRAVSLGTCDTLLSHPASMTHYGVAEKDRIKYGITNGLIRMSVGIENVADIMNDLDQALS